MSECVVDERTNQSDFFQFGASAHSAVASRIRGRSHKRLQNAKRAAFITSPPRYSDFYWPKREGGRESRKREREHERETCGAFYASP